MQSKKKRNDGVFYGGLTVLLLVLIGADVAYFRQASERPAAPAVATVEPQVLECRYDAAKAPVDDFEALVGANDPMKGQADAPVTVIEFFDPNCPHCKTLHPTMNEVIAAYGDQARFVYKALALPGWDHSVPQVAALMAAQEEGKFFEMLDRQFALQRPSGLSLDQLKAIAEEIGMDGEAMAEKIQNDRYVDAMREVLDQARGAGLTGVPAVLINGRFVEGQARSVDCLGTLIEEAEQ